LEKNEVNPAMKLTSGLFFQPLFPSDSLIQDYFPPRVWAIRLPAIVLVLGLGVVGLFVGSVMQKEAAKKRAKELRKGA
jgi:dolichyl-phosphate mannosyltransferase polypeptide 2 regulatory subunit